MTPKKEVLKLLVEHEVALNKFKFEKRCTTKKHAAIFVNLVRVHWSAIPLSSFPYLSIRNLCTETSDAFQKNRPPETFRWTSQDAAHQKEQAKYYQLLGPKWSSLKDQNWPSLGFQICPEALGVLSKQTHVIFENFCGLIDVATSLLFFFFFFFIFFFFFRLSFLSLSVDCHQQQQQGNKTNAQFQRPNNNHLENNPWKVKSKHHTPGLHLWLVNQPTPNLPP